MAQASRSRKTSAHSHAGIPLGDGEVLYRSQEVVGVLPNEDELESVIDEFFCAGFDRYQISVLAYRGAGDEGSTGSVADAFVADMEDDPRAPLGAYVSLHSRAELQAAAVGVPTYVLGVGGCAVVVASGGSLAFALAALLLAGAAGASLGGLLARTIARHHHDAVTAQVAQGGLLLWVRVRSLAQEKKAIQLLTNHRGRHVHVHDVERGWGIDAVPFHNAQPDPFLVHTPERG